MKEVTQERYDDMLEVLPPMYLSEIDGKKVKNGFAVSEALSQNDDGPTFVGYWEEDGKFFSSEVSVIKPNGKNVGWNYYAHAFTKGNTAKTITGGYFDKKEI